MKTLIAGIAAIVLAASPALAQDKRKAASKDEKGAKAASSTKGQPSGSKKQDFRYDLGKNKKS